MEQTQFVEEIAVITHCFGLFVEEIILSHSMYSGSTELLLPKYVEESVSTICGRNNTHLQRVAAVAECYFFRNLWKFCSNSQ